MRRLRDWLLWKLLTVDEYGWLQVDRSLRRPGKVPRTKGQISYLFERAFCNSGGLIVQCDYCGRLYFGTDGDYESGERESLEESQAAEPTKYISVEGFTSRVEIHGRSYAAECECGAALPYEAFVWNNRFSISSYLNARFKAEASAALRDSDIGAVVVPDGVLTP